jgi:hypothetical protein
MIRLSFDLSAELQMIISPEIQAPAGHPVDARMSSADLSEWSQ